MKDGSDHPDRNSRSRGSERIPFQIERKVKIMTVKNLMNRVIEAFRNKGHEVYWINHIRSEKVSSTLPHKTIAVLETFRMNHTELDNVTVTIEVQEWEGHSGRRIFKTKVPKNASDKVINNRVDKVIEVLNQ